MSIDGGIWGVNSSIGWQNSAWTSSGTGWGFQGSSGTSPPRNSQSTPPPPPPPPPPGRATTLVRKFSLEFGKNFLTGQLLQWLLWVRFCRFVFDFFTSVFNSLTNGLDSTRLCSSSSSAINFSCSTWEPRSPHQLDSCRMNSKGFSSLKVSLNLRKDKDSCVFPSTTWKGYTVISF